MDKYTHSAKIRKIMSKAKMGDKNPRWNDGVSEYLNHCELKRNRIKALESKEYKCEHCKKLAKITHHINGNKSDHSIGNLLVLCYRCHGRLHRGGIKKSKYRYLYSMSLFEISNKTGLSSPTILDYFNNKRKPHLKTERKMKEFREQALG